MDMTERLKVVLIGIGFTFFLGIGPYHIFNWLEGRWGWLTNVVTITWLWSSFVGFYIGYVIGHRVGEREKHRITL